jgi:hypothetical protein
VHLSGGDVDVFSAEAELAIEGTNIVILHRRRAIAWYRSTDIYFSCRIRAAAPPAA